MSLSAERAEDQLPEGSDAAPDAVAKVPTAGKLFKRKFKGVPLRMIDSADASDPRAPQILPEIAEECALEAPKDMPPQPEAPTPAMLGPRRSSSSRGRMKKMAELKPRDQSEGALQLHAMTRALAHKTQCTTRCAAGVGDGPCSAPKCARPGQLPPTWASGWASPCPCTSHKDLDAQIQVGEAVLPAVQRVREADLHTVRAGDGAVPRGTPGEKGLVGRKLGPRSRPSALSVGRSPLSQISGQQLPSQSAGLHASPQVANPAVVVDGVPQCVCRGPTSVLSAQPTSLLCRVACQSCV